MTVQGTTRIAGWSIRHPWWAIGLWLGFVAAAVVAGGMTEVRQATSADLGVGESGRADRIIESVEFDDPPTDLVLITPREGASWDQTAARAAAGELADRLAPLVARAGEPVAAPVADALLLPLTLTED